MFLLASASFAGCGGEELAPDVEEIEEIEAPFESDIATLMDFELDGEILTTPASAYSPAIRAQMFYGVGALNAAPQPEAKAGTEV